MKYINYGTEFKNQKFCKKSFITNVLLVGVLVGLVVICKLPIESDINNPPIYLYQDSSEKIHIELENGEFIETDDQNYKYIPRSGELYVIQEEDLYIYKRDGSSLKIAEDVLKYDVSQDGKVVIYAIKSENHLTEYEWYYYKEGQDALEFEYSYEDEYLMSDNGKYIVYYKDSDDLPRDIYLFDENGNNNLIIENYLSKDTGYSRIYVSNNGDVLYIESDSHDLMMIKHEGKTERIANDIKRCVATDDFERIYALDCDGILEVYEDENWKELEKIGEDSTGSFKKIKLLNGEDYVVYDDYKGNMVLIKDCQIIEFENAYSGLLLQDGQYFCYVDGESNLYACSIEGMKVSAENKIGQGMWYPFMFFQEVGEGIIYFIGGDQELYRYDFKGDPKSIAKDVSKFTVTKDEVVYYTNLYKELYRINKGGYHEQILDYISSIECSGYGSIFALDVDYNLYQITDYSIKTIETNIYYSWIEGRRIKSNY